MTDDLSLRDLQRLLMQAVGHGLDNDMAAAVAIFDDVQFDHGWDRLAAMSGGLCALAKQALHKIEPLPEGALWGVHPRLADVAAREDCPGAVFAMQYLTAFVNDDRDMAGAILRAALDKPDPEFFAEGFLFLFRFTVDVIRDMPVKEAQ